MKRIQLDRRKCRHKELAEVDEYSYIPGEAVMQIERTVYFCVKCKKQIR